MTLTKIDPAQVLDCELKDLTVERLQQALKYWSKESGLSLIVEGCFAWACKPQWLDASIVSYPVTQIQPGACEGTYVEAVCDIQAGDKIDRNVAVFSIKCGSDGEVIQSMQGLVKALDWIH